MPAVGYGQRLLDFWEEAMEAGHLVLLEEMVAAKAMEEPAGLVQLVPRVRVIQWLIQILMGKGLT